MVVRDIIPFLPPNAADQGGAILVYHVVPLPRVRRSGLEDHGFFEVQVVRACTDGSGHGLEWDVTSSVKLDVVLVGTVLEDLGEFPIERLLK